MGTILVVLAFGQQSIMPPPPPMFVQPLAVGDIVVMESKITKMIERSGAKLALIVFFNPKKEEEYAAYGLFYAEALQTLFNGSLISIGIANNDSQATEKFNEKYGFNLPLITDPDFDLHRQYGIAAGYSGVFIEDSKGVIRYSDNETFSNSKIMEEIEKILGEIQVQTTDDPFSSNKKMPELKLIDESGKLVTISSLYGSPMIVTLLPPSILRCGSCPGARRLEVLNGLTDSLNIIQVAIIQYPASPEELIHLKEKLNIKFPILSALNFGQIIFETISYPVTFLLNRDGNILQTIAADKAVTDILSVIKSYSERN